MALTNGIDDLYCFSFAFFFTFYHFVLRQIHECCFPCLAFISCDSCRNCFLRSSIQCYFVLGSFAIRIECELYRCASRRCCSSVCILPGFDGISICLFLCICNGLATCYRICCRCCIAGIGCSFCDRVLNLYGRAIYDIVLRQVYKLSLPGFALVAAGNLRSRIDCTIKCYRVLGCFSIRIQRVSYLAALRCRSSAVRIHPSLESIGRCRILGVGDLTSGAYRFCCRRSISGIRCGFCDRINNFICCSRLVFGQM